VDSQSLTILVGLGGLIVTNIVQMMRQNASARDLRERDAAAAKVQDERTAATQKLIDDRARRDREWLVEDRRTLAADLERKVQSTADTLAAKVAADQVTLAQTAQQHATDLAALVRHDQAVLGAKVDSATTTASNAVVDLSARLQENTALTTEAKDAAALAYDVGNHTRDKLEEIAATAFAAAATHGPDAHRRSTDPPSTNYTRKGP